MLLTIDIGNTNTVLGVFDGEAIVEHSRIATVPDRTADEIAVVLHGLLAQSGAFKEADLYGISLCSTVPSVLHEMREMSSRYFADVPAVIVEPGVKTGVPIRMDNPKEVGSDRIMNSLAAVHLYGGPAIVVDFGTSTNFNAVSARGEFVGGALAPGIEISVDALSRRAAPNQGLGQRNACCGESGGSRRMGVADCLDIRTHAVNQQVHADFAGHVAASGNALAVEINNHHVGWAHRALAEAGGRDQDAVAREPDREIPVHCRHEPPLVEHESVTDNFFPVFAFARHEYPLGGS